MIVVVVLHRALKSSLRSTLRRRLTFRRCFVRIETVRSRCGGCAVCSPCLYWNCLSDQTRPPPPPPPPWCWGFIIPSVPVHGRISHRALCSVLPQLSLNLSDFLFALDVPCEGSTIFLRVFYLFRLLHLWSPCFWCWLVLWRCCGVLLSCA